MQKAPVLRAGVLFSYFSPRGEGRFATFSHKGRRQEAKQKTPTRRPAFLFVRSDDAIS